MASILSPRERGKLPTMRAKGGNTQDVLPVKFMLGALVVFLTACLLTSVMYLRTANREMLWLVNAVRQQDEAMTNLEGRFKRAHAAEEALGELTSKYSILQTEAAGLKQDRDRLATELQAARTQAAEGQQAAAAAATEAQRQLQEQVAQLDAQRQQLAAQVQQLQADAATSGNAAAVAAAAAEATQLRQQLAEATKAGQQYAGLLGRVSSELAAMSARADLLPADASQLLAAVSREREAIDGAAAAAGVAA